MCRIEPMVDKFLGQLVKEPRHSVAIYVIGEFNGYGTANPHWWEKYYYYCNIIKGLDVSGILEAVQKGWLPKSLLHELLVEEIDISNLDEIADTLTVQQKALLVKLLRAYMEQLEKDMED